jgi:hypothetical protein
LFILSHHKQTVTEQELTFQPKYPLGNKQRKVNGPYWVSAPAKMDNNKEIIQENGDGSENCNNLFDFKTMDDAVMLTPDTGAEKALTGLPQSSHESLNIAANLIFEPVPSQTVSDNALDLIVSTGQHLTPVF